MKQAPLTMTVSVTFQMLCHKTKAYTAHQNTPYCQILQQNLNLTTLTLRLKIDCAILTCNGRLTCVLRNVSLDNDLVLSFRGIASMG